MALPSSRPEPAHRLGPIAVRPARVPDRQAFDAFVGSHPGGGILQSWAWGDLRARQRWRPVRLLARDGLGRVCGSASVLCRDLPLGGRILYVPRGPVLDYGDSRVLDAMVAALARLGRQERAVLCKIDPPVSIPAPGVMRALQRRGFVVGHRRGRFGGLQPRRNVIVPLHGGAEAVLQRFAGKTRYNVRLAAKRGVAVRRSGRDELPAFHRLLLETCARDGFAERELGYFQEVWDVLEPGGHMELYLASWQGRDLAAGVLLLHGDHATYAYGASSGEHREVMAPYAVQWAMIQRAASMGCARYDMTGVPERLREGEAGYGLYRFKRGFWPELTEFVGEMDLPLQPALYRCWNVAEPAYWGGHVLLHRARRALHPLGEGPAAQAGD